MNVRRWICAGTVIACLPYLLLKIAWVAGWEVGVSGDDFDDTTRVANIVTAALELVAIGVALCFVLPFGRRLPAFLVAFPAWVATGLLVPVGLGALLGSLVQLCSGGGNAFAGNDTLAGWVYVLVYVGFAAQAVLLLSGFVLYARDRWPVVTRGGRAAQVSLAARGLQELLGVVLVVTASAFAVQQAVWALRGGGSFDDPTAAQRTFLAVGAATAVAGAAGALGLLRGRRLTGTRVAVLWLGTAVPFTSAFLDTLERVTLEPGAWGAPEADPANGFLTLLVLLGALAGALGGTLRLVQAEAGQRPVCDR